MDDVLRFKMFGTFRLLYKDENYNLEEILGKQLSSILALLLVNKSQIISKNRLIDTYWTESDNPNNALKYAIFRLRNKLNEYDFLENLVVTASGGYQINSDFNVEIDCLKLKELVALGKDKNDVEMIYQGFDIYSLSFLMNFDDEWINSTRRYYERYVLEVAKYLHDYYLKNEDYQKAKDISYQALRLDEYNEGFIYYYINDLIKTKNYNEALKYYDYISKQYQIVMNDILDPRINELFKLSKIPSEEAKISFQDKTYKNSFSGPLECDVFSFKKLCELEYRNHIRSQKRIKLITLELKSKDNQKYIERLVDVVNKTLRVNDTYTRRSNKEINIILELANPDDEFIVIERILNKFYHHISQDKCRVNYYIEEIEDILK